MTNCDHPSTFICGDKSRCNVCYADAIGIDDTGKIVFPAQDHPFSWDEDRIATWFLAGPAYQPQGCDGFTFTRNNLPPARATYGYVWKELYLDLDYEGAWMLDVRRHDDTNEYRQFLFVGSGSHRTRHVAWHGTSVPFGADTETYAARLVDAIRWFADQVAIWEGMNR